MTGEDDLAGRRLLVVEDEYFLAEDMTKALSARGAEVLGPVGNVDAALALIREAGRIDGAVLDINLRGEMAYPVADLLLARGIPFVFVTGYDQEAIPPPYAAVRRCEKPVPLSRLLQALLGPV
jgi:CheY-like chemotaxis protein